MRMWKVAGEALDASATSPRAGTWPHSCPPDQPHTPRAALLLPGSCGHSSMPASGGLGIPLWVSGSGSGSGSGVVLSAPPSLQLTHACSNVVTTGHGTERLVSQVSSAPEPGSATIANKAVSIPAAPTISDRTGRTTSTWPLCSSVAPPGGPPHCATGPPTHPSPNHTFPVSQLLWSPPSTPAHCPPAATAAAAVRSLHRGRGSPRRRPATSPAPGACNSLTDQPGTGTVGGMGSTTIAHGPMGAANSGRAELKRGPEQQVPAAPGPGGAGHGEAEAGASGGFTPAGAGTGLVGERTAAVGYCAGPMPMVGAEGQLQGGAQLPQRSHEHEQAEDLQGQRGGRGVEMREKGHEEDRQEEHDGQEVWAAAGVVAHETCGEQQQQQKEQVGQELEGGWGSSSGRVHKRQRSQSADGPGRSPGVAAPGADTAAGRQASGEQHEPDEVGQGRGDLGPSSMEGVEYGGMRSSSAQREQAAAVASAGESPRPHAPCWFPQVVVTSGATLPMVGNGTASPHCTPSPRCTASPRAGARAREREGGDRDGLVGSEEGCGSGASWGSTDSG